MKRTRKCKHCKEEFEKVHGLQKFCFKDECKKVWIETEKEKQWRKERKEWYKENETVQSLMKKLQPIFNQYIRLRDKDKPCISCGRELKGKFDAGHFYSSGGHKSVTFNEDNVHGQCVHCNQHKHGNLHEYNEGIKERIGQARFLELRSKAQETKKYTREELRGLIVFYKEKIKQLKKK